MERLQNPHQKPPPNLQQRPCPSLSSHRVRCHRWPWMWVYLPRLALLTGGPMCNKTDCPGALNRGLIDLDCVCVCVITVLPHSLQQGTVTAHACPVCNSPGWVSGRGFLDVSNRAAMRDCEIARVWTCMQVGAWTRGKEDASGLLSCFNSALPAVIP